MGDACCGSVAPAPSGGADVADEHEGRWRLAAAAIAAVAWLVGIVFEPQERDGHVRVADEAQRDGHDLQRWIRVGRALDVVEEFGPEVGPMAHTAVVEVRDERQGREPLHVRLLQDRSRPAQRRPGVLVEVAHVELSDTGCVVVALHHDGPDGPHALDALGGPRAVADDVPHAQDSFDSLLLEPHEHGVERRKVRMDVTEDPGSHAVRPGG